MKKYLAILLTVIMVMGSLVGCTPKNKDKDDNLDNNVNNEVDNNNNDKGNDDEVVVDDEKKDLGVVLIVNTNLGDKSFCDLSNEGMLRAAEELGLRTKVVELNGDATKQVPTFIEFAENPDWDIIISGTYNVAESLQTVAQDYHDKMFVLYDAKADYEEYDIPNLYSVEHLQNEGSFLVGAAAALLTTSGQEGTNAEKIIGFVGGGENTSINDFLVGYIQGAKSIDEDMKVLISYIGDFTDSAKGKEMALGQINQGADVVFGVAGGAGLGVLDAAKEKKVYSVGVDSDQAMVLEESDPILAASISTSMVKKVDNTVYNAIKRAVEGTLPFGTYEKVGIAQDTVGMAVNKYTEALFTAEQLAHLEEVKASIVSGEKKVESAIGMNNEDVQRIKDSARP
ncbi:MAG TPA: BMP family ABC transporter substrate-binding protein [Clostridiales bacterium]|nr:BMP family ABC transporter substrate-binding protein [Clostridiales bacterium]